MAESWKTVVLGDQQLCVIQIFRIWLPSSYGVNSLCLDVIRQQKNLKSNGIQTELNVCLLMKVMWYYLGPVSLPYLRTNLSVKYDTVNFRIFQNVIDAGWAPGSKHQTAKVSAYSYLPCQIVYTMLPCLLYRLYGGMWRGVHSFRV